MEFFKYNLIVLFFLAAILQVEAQEIPIRSIPIPAVERKEEKKAPEPTPIKIDPVIKEEQPKAEAPISIKKQDAEFSMFDNSTLRDPGEIFDQKWNKKAVEQGFRIDLLLTGNFKSFDVPLVEGINKIEFVALNQGESGPNTAEFQVFDDNGVLVSSKKWNLLTGVTASIILIKDK